MWKVGLVGTGYWSEKHLHAWRRIPGVQVVALCNRSVGKMLDRAQAFGIPESACYTSIDAMLAEAELDIVDIVTGPETHLEFVEKASAAGKHIMCQKPFARSLEEAERMVSVTKKAGVRLMVTENWRWLQPFQTIKHVIESGTLGRIHTARYMHSDFYTTRMAPDKSIPQPFFRAMPHLLFYEMGAHWFDTWRFLFGEPSRLYAVLTSVSPYVVGEDGGVVTLGHEHFYGTLDMSWSTRRELQGTPGDEVKANHKESFLIEGDKGTIRYGASGQITVIDNEGAVSVVAESTELDHEESHYRLQSHFISCLNDGTAFQTSGEDNLRTLQLIFATYESAREHQVIPIGFETP
ncbi:Gfo/Idh/MocA family protein [Paenibacillus koleovorans]|uniref:Gfo/Idh/MocA family protein n=1 Tax=Paenibacillus koleovorans TaxID=121608 RepID=UPI000FD83C22|nr:Gfo/Idh/MocA family oxidoreductase [Paenibacillus koleovorans]